MGTDFKNMYRQLQLEEFPQELEISFGSGANLQRLCYSKVTWNLDEGQAGLRYGENPDQKAALYQLVSGRVQLGQDVLFAGNFVLASNPQLLQSGKHPSKINITDADAALGILRWFDEPCCVIIKHNNPCGVALGNSPEESFLRAYDADRTAAFGGCVGLNRNMDKATAEAILSHYVEVVLAPDYEEGVLDLFKKKPNIRVLKIPGMVNLSQNATQRVLEWKSLIDGGLIVQWSFVPNARRPDQFYIAEAEHQGRVYRCQRQPTDAEWKDIIFGWLVESGVTSNSVIYVHNGATVGIGTGEQDRVGVAEIARDKAYRKTKERLAWNLFNKTLAQLTPDEEHAVEAETQAIKGGLLGSVMVSDGFFPFRDGIDVGLREGVTAVVQPGGSLRDFESIQACNEFGAAMVFTGQRSFRH